MLTLLELLLSEVAAHHLVAVLIDAIDEVLAGHADHAAFPVLQVSIVEKIPLLQAFQCEYTCITPGGTARSTMSKQR